MNISVTGTGKKVDKIEVVGTLRRAQLVTTFGSGAIVDLPDYSVIIAASNYWKKGPILHEANLERLLKVPYFVEPHTADESNEGNSPDIPAFRFPTMHFCPECHRLMPFWKFGDDAGKKCNRCSTSIVPSRFVAACINGHLEDFPYNWWVHYGDYSGCKTVSEGMDSNLEISFSHESGGLESIVITCKACGKSRSMAGCMAKDALKGYRCRGKRPWVGMRSKYYDPEPCNAQMRCLQRGAANVYFSQTASALTIPPWSTRISQEIVAQWDFLSEKLNAGIDKDHLKTYVEGRFAPLLQTGLYTTDDILTEIERYRRNGEGGEYTKQDLYEDEYKVFCIGNYDDTDDFQFRIERTGVPEILENYVKDIVMVKRLREVLALKGFRRITTEIPRGDEDDDTFEGYNLKNDIVPLNSEPVKTKWYPGIEMIGEGIFIRLNEDALEEWEHNNIEFYEPMHQRLLKSNLDCGNFSPRYVLLHTLSHLLIRQLSVECGYSSASVKERIYSTYPDSDCKMCGILLYTSSSDSDGSLGGLARNAMTMTFENLFRNMLQEASWCSSDPICISSTAQGYESLNYAACHACALLPETSCEMRNCLLDRGAVIGSFEDRKRGFFGKIL